MKRQIRRAPGIRASAITNNTVRGACSALVLLCLRGITSHSIGSSDAKDPSQIEQGRGVQLKKGPLSPSKHMPLATIMIITSPALACLQVPTTAYAGWARCW